MEAKQGSVGSGSMEGEFASALAVFLEGEDGACARVLERICVCGCVCALVWCLVCVCVCVCGVWCVSVCQCRLVVRTRASHARDRGFDPLH